MSRNTKLVLWAMGISFAGSLPLGTLNLSVASYALHHDLQGAIGFSVTAIAVEVLLVRIALFAVGRLEGLKRFHTFFRLLACIVLLVFAGTTLVSAYHSGPFNIALPFITLPPIAAGALLSIINPLHLPFWIGWTAVLRSRKILDAGAASYNRFTIAIGIGTAMAFVAYGISGRYLIDLLGRRQAWLGWIVGITLLLTALLQLYKLLPLRRKPSPAA